MAISENLLTPTGDQVVYASNSSTGYFHFHFSVIAAQALWRVTSLMPHHHEVVCWLTSWKRRARRPRRRIATDLVRARA